VLAILLLWSVVAFRMCAPERNTLRPNPALSRTRRCGACLPSEHRWRRAG
jgi:hypothetical protein